VVPGRGQSLPLAGAPDHHLARAPRELGRAGAGQVAARRWHVGDDHGTHQPVVRNFGLPIFVETIVKLLCDVGLAGALPAVLYRVVNGTSTSTWTGACGHGTSSACSGIWPST